MQIQITLHDGPELRYLQANANVRGMTKTRLMNKLLRVVLADKMIQSVLDDEWGLPPAGETPLARVRRQALVALSK